MTKKFWTFSLTPTTILMFLEEKETKLKHVELRSFMSHVTVMHLSKIKMK